MLTLCQLFHISVNSVSTQCHLDAVIDPADQPGEEAVIDSLAQSVTCVHSLKELGEGKNNKL